MFVYDMLVLYVLMIWQGQGSGLHQFNMYNTNHGQDRYCLLYYVQDNIVQYYEQNIIVTHQIIPYCLRLSEGSIFFAKSIFNDTIDSSLTFDELQKKNISSELLLSWSASLELAELYQIFLDNITHSSMSSSDKNPSFDSCASPWFGPFCRFTFDPYINESFDEIVAFNFERKFRIQNGSKVTCYEHLYCKTSLLCLDWREICDRKADCLDGSDELHCWQLEISECADNEYRCHNGQCIPNTFFHDATLNPDCLDRTDEPIVSGYPSDCISDPAFRCEEHTCRPGTREFPCGDGQCVSEMEFSCRNGRDNVLPSNLCSKAMACRTRPYYEFDKEWCEQFCDFIYCAKDYCPSVYDFPPSPVLFGHVRLVFSNEDREIASFPITPPDYVCYDERLCIDFLPATVFPKNWTCRSPSELGLKELENYMDLFPFIKDLKNRFRGCLVIPNETHYCNSSSMYQCINSRKCISKYRLVDGIRDCPLDDDETFNQSCSLNDTHYRFECSVANKKTCFAPLTIQDTTKHCKNGEDERHKDIKLTEDHIFFQTVCDGNQELSPMWIDGRFHTDETECEHWSCNNTSTRCNGFWSCPNGTDEINCPSSACLAFEHPCVFLNDTSRVSCLPIARAGDGFVDCLGASDERKWCRERYSDNPYARFRCQDRDACIPLTQLCDRQRDCWLSDDESFCTRFKTDFCYSAFVVSRTDVEELFCSMLDSVKSPIVYFKLANMPTYSLELSTNIVPFTSPTQIPSPSVQRKRNVNIRDAHTGQCNRGLVIHIRMMNGTRELLCLCPPSYYGDTCQYQNQRVSLTLQIRMTSDWRNVFTFIIMLIDHSKNIESLDFIEYLSIRDCDTKFNIYLLYATRPKDSNKKYSVQIDVFNKLTMNYRASWIYPLQFPFLPVHRLAIRLIVPHVNVEPFRGCSLACIHGQCFTYINSQHSMFCRCFPGWSGTHCTVEHRCECAPGSLCISSSFCICPLGKYGPRCLFRQSSCHSNLCANGGQCVSRDERYSAAHVSRSTCICRMEYSGHRCEYGQTRIDISFDNSLTIPQLLLLHFFSVQNASEPIRTSMMRRIPFNQDSLILYTSIRFQMAFAEMFSNYYLIILREQQIVSTRISTKIDPSHRCAFIDELFNETVLNQHLLRRIKLYHIPCRERHELVCFYDLVHLCLCDLERQASCFEFDPNITYHCHGFGVCENDGQCFEDDRKCPTSSICACRECYYGSRCQFSTKGSTLSLDAILGYQVRLNTNISEQSIVVIFSIIIATTIFGLGLISNIFSFLTFREKGTRNVGCGLYLFVCSIISLAIMNIFMFKFWLLLTIQMNLIKNRLFVHVQCVFLDFILQVLLNTSEWLSVCVAIERAVNILKGANFNKTRSKQVAKWIILTVFLLTISTNLQDPIHRHLIDDEDEKRTWCITKYSSSLQIFDRVMNLFHFFVPFSINLISALIIIITATRTRSNVQRKQPYKQVLREQFHHHKYLLISPLTLVILALPRLIISFLFGCMKSTRNSWIYLIGYFISFIPPMLTFVVFILPSEMYKKEFRKLIKRFWQQ